MKFHYEYLPGKGKIGLTAFFANRTNKNEMYMYLGSYGADDIAYNPMFYLRWHAGIGTNFYIFPPGFFRLMTGLSYMTGEYKVERMVSSGYETEYYLGYKTLNSLISSWMLCVEPVDDLQVKGGFEVPLYNDAIFSVPWIRVDVSLGF
jgi:hypothetical protein